ncbi:MAG: hypothetical protein ACRD3K_02425, partial [Edaphobacter sp.]
MKQKAKSPSVSLTLLALTLGAVLTCSPGVQAQAPNLQTAVENTNIQTLQDQKIQQLQDKLEEIQRELTELKKANSPQPETRP